MTNQRNDSKQTLCGVQNLWSGVASSASRPVVAPPHKKVLVALRSYRAVVTCRAPPQASGGRWCGGCDWRRIVCRHQRCRRRWRCCRGRRCVADDKRVNLTKVEYCSENIHIRRTAAITAAAICAATETAGDTCAQLTYLSC